MRDGAEEEAGGVVGTAAGVGQLDEGLGGLLGGEVGAGGEDGGDFVRGDVAGEAV